MITELIQKLFGTAVGRACTNAYCHFTIPDNAAYCEKPTGSLIERPGYAISNLPYLFLGLYLLLVPRNRLAKVFGLTAFAVGFFSMIYDITYTHAAQYFDWLGMTSFILVLVCLNLKRIFSWANRRTTIVYAILFLAYAGITYTLGISCSSALFVSGVVFVIISETYLWLKSRQDKQQQFHMQFWLAAIALFLSAWLIWQLDSQQLVCDPTNLLNGRGIFHYCTSICIYLLYRHYRQLSQKVL